METDCCQNQMTELNNSLQVTETNLSVDIKRSSEIINQENQEHQIFMEQIRSIIVKEIQDEEVINDYFRTSNSRYKKECERYIER